MVLADILLFIEAAAREIVRRLFFFAESSLDLKLTSSFTIRVSEIQFEPLGLYK